MTGPLAKFKILISLSFFAFIVNCGGGGGSANDSTPLGEIVSCGGGTTNATRVSPYFVDGPIELAYCSSPVVYTSPAVISGTAQYEAWDLTASGLGPSFSTNPIRYAEVRISDASGALVQCAETDKDGNFQFDLPLDQRSYSISIFSRGSNEHVMASVMNAPEANSPYRLTTTMTSNASSQTIPNMLASRSGDLLGAAFNLLDQAVSMNKFLRAQVGATNGPSDEAQGGTCPFTGCADFTTTPKLNIFWCKGFNPNGYFNSSQGLSFYIPGFNRTFITGGLNGDVNSSDTDHFDNAVIIHEYGHFLEDVYSSTDTPGGAHFGIFPVDPRLAWSEGWGYFIQSAILDSGTVVDTSGNSDGTSDYLFNFSLETEPTGCASAPTTQGCDVPQVANEGNFREFSISRILWDSIDTANDSETVSLSFPDIWASMTSSVGFQNSNVGFRSIGLLHDLQSTVITGAQDWSSIRSIHKHTTDRSEYAFYLDDVGGCGTRNFELVPFNDPFDDANLPTNDILGRTHPFLRTNLTRNNNFFQYNHPTTGAATFTLNYLPRTGGSGPEADLDLYIYQEEHSIGADSSIVGFAQTRPDNVLTTVETQVANITSLPAGKYLIQVILYTDDITGNTYPDTTDYELLLNGTQLCHVTIPGQ